MRRLKTILVIVHGQCWTTDRWTLLIIDIWTLYQMTNKTTIIPTSKVGLPKLTLSASCRVDLNTLSQSEHIHPQLTRHFSKYSKCMERTHRDTLGFENNKICSDLEFVPFFLGGKRVQNSLSRKLPTFQTDFGAEM